MRNIRLFVLEVSYSISLVVLLTFWPDLSHEWIVACPMEPRLEIYGHDSHFSGWIIHLLDQSPFA
jgi:hypothetical protein